MENIEIMKEYLLNNNLTHLVRGPASGLGMDVNSAIEMENMGNIEFMKEYILNNNLTHLVRELVCGHGMDVNSAIEYVFKEAQA